MNFGQVLKHGMMMLVWWGAGGVGVLIALFLLWNSLKLPVNFALMIVSFVVLFISILAIWYGTKKYDLS